ncbi:hypothetical protein TNCV_1519851 [Trichonephila clavipes]|nr:hypothetical protein TNCV_1519851 [Trichonephila clavipes]
MKQLVSPWNLMKHFLRSTITLLKERAFLWNLLQLAIPQFQSNLLQLAVPKESDEITCSSQGIWRSNRHPVLKSSKVRFN